jgi:hypothetical protein
MSIQRSSRPDGTPGRESGVGETDQHARGDDPPRQAGPQAQPLTAVGVHFAHGHGQVPPFRPPDPVGGFIGPSIPPRRTEWVLLWLALILSILVMVGICLAGFAAYNHRGI